MTLINAVPRMVAALLCLALMMSVVRSASAAAPTFSPTNLTGQWMFQMLPAKGFSADAPGDPGNVAGAGRQDLLHVGTLMFDGASAVSAHVLATTDDNAGNTVIIDYTFAGTYTMNTNGVGTMTVTPTVTDLSCTPAQAAGVCATFEAAETYAISMTRNRGFSIIQTTTAASAKIYLRGEAQKQSGSFASPALLSVTKVKNNWSFNLGPAKSFTADAAGDPGGIAGAPRQDLLRVGRMFFNGAGGVSGHTIATTLDNAGATVIIEFDWSGTYFVNSDGTGTLTMTPQPLTDANCTPVQPPGNCATFEGTETYSIAIVPKRGRIYLAQTDNVGSGAKIFLAGEANYQ